jgi:hypothetical protein
MTINHIRIARLIVAMVLVIAALEQSTHAQVEVAPKQLEDVLPADRDMIREEDFDRWFFSLLGGKDAARLQLESSLAARVEKIARQCDLTEVQKRKLLLAGRGDIKRLFDLEDEMRKRLYRKADFRAKMRETGGELRPLRIESADVFGEGSIFEKTFKSALTPLQFAQYEKAARDGAASRHRATIRWAVATLDTILELSAEAHRQLEALLVEQTRPPRYFGEYDYYGVLFQASKIHESRFRSILSERQWAKLSKHIAESKRLLPTLKAGGFIPDDDVAAATGPVDRPAAKQQKKRG